MASGSVSIRHLLGASNSARALRSDRARSVVTQAFSPVLISRRPQSGAARNPSMSRRLNASAMARPSSGRGVLELRRRTHSSSSNLASAASRSASSNTSQRLSRSPSNVRGVISLPLGVEALLRSPMPAWVTTSSEVGQPMHGLDVDRDVRSDVPRGTDVRDHVTGRECGAPRRWSMFTQSGVVGGKFTPIERGVRLRDELTTCARGQPPRPRGSEHRAPRRRRRCHRDRRSRCREPGHRH